MRDNKNDNKNNNMSFNKVFLSRYKYTIPISFSIIMALMVIISLVGTIPLKNNSALMQTTAEEHSINDELLRTMYQSGLKRSILLFEMLNTDDPFEIDDHYMSLNLLATQFTIAREAYSKTDLNDDLKALFAKQSKFARETAPKQNKVYELLQQEKKEEATRFFIEDTLPNSKIFLDIINEMAEAENIRSKSIFTASHDQNKNVLSSILLSDLITIILSVLLTLFVLRRHRFKEKQLNIKANTDTLTSLPNRSCFTREIDNQIKHNPSENFAIIFFDIDYFKTINDNYGHEIGDEVIKNFSSKIKEYIGEKDVLSRFGGDEFVLMLRSIKDKPDIIGFISYLSCALDTSYMINNNEIFITSSIGVSMYAKDGNDSQTLLKNADVAMYTAKQTGRNCFQFFSKESSDKLQREHKLSHALHTIIKNRNETNELYLKYQPLLNLDEDGHITECEALIRWNDITGKNILPSEFIPLAEKSNLIEKINLFVINEACKQQLDWQKSGYDSVRININLSGNKLIFKKLLKQFHLNLKHMNLSPSLFGIELTERTLNQISEETINELKFMRDQGMKISIDDFGTDYSSLIYLKRLPVTTLKIDRAFITDLPYDREDIALVKTIITLGHSLKLDVVAEGVETDEQLQFLKDNSCDIAQGYHFHHPLDGDALSDLLRLEQAA